MGINCHIAELERRYGSKDLAVVTTKQKLLSLQLRGAGYEKVQALVQAVRTARTTLRAHGAEDQLFGDYSTIGLLVAKLPAAVQDRWDFHAAALQTEDTPQGRGEAFCRWLEVEGGAATSARLRNLACDQQQGPRIPGGETGVRCGRCHKTGHSRAECPSSAVPEVTLAGNAHAAAAEVSGGRPKGGGGPAARDAGHIPREDWAVKLKTEDGCTELVRRLIQQGADCPVCKLVHWFKRKVPWGETDWPSNRMESCPAFKAKTAPQRAKLLEDLGGCILCTSWAHPRNLCNFKEPKNPGPGARTIKCQEKSGTGVCGKEHHRLLHGSDTSHASVNAARLQPRLAGDPRPDIFRGQPGGLLAAGAAGAVFEILEAPIHSQEGRKEQGVVFADPGSNMNFITHDLAGRLQLQGTKTNIYLKVVDSEYQAKEVKIYQLGVEDGAKKVHWMEAVGVSSITDAVPLVKEETIKEVFPEIKKEALQRPVGPVDLLLSMTERELHSGGGRIVGKLRLAETILGCGQVLTGVVPGQAGAREGEEVSAECRCLQGAVPYQPARGQAFRISGLVRATEALLGGGELDARVPPLCGACRGCKDCRFRRERCTEDQRAVLQQVEEEMVLEEGKLTASYPWKTAVMKMRSNRQQVVKIQEKIEARNIKTGNQEEYIKEMEKAFDEGTVSELSEEEMDSYNGPVNYNNHFEVLKEGSTSTKLRIVSNSAQKNARSGLSLNDCMKTGPDEMALLAEVLLHFRTVLKAAILDLTKAYQSIRMRKMELHLRRFLWRRSPEEPWKDCGYTRATFGDKAAALLLEVGKRRAAQEGEHIDPMAAEQIRDKLYVDDGFAGGSEEDVRRMVGDLKEDGGYDGTVSRILETCGLKVKFMAVTGDDTPGAADPLNGKILGLEYKLAEDKFTFGISMKFNLRGKFRQKQAVELDTRELERIRLGQRIFTRREALSFVAGNFDPLGYLSPVLLTGRLLLRGLYGQQAITWDSDLPGEEKSEWVGWLQDLEKETAITMNRTVRPKEALGEPRLAGFSDASNEAMCAVVYNIWDTPEGPDPRLLLAKVRVTPVSGLSVPRAELQAMVMLTRIFITAAKASAAKISTVTLTTDTLPGCSKTIRCRTESLLCQ